MYDKTKIQEAYEKIRNSEKIDEGKLTQKIRAMTKTFLEVRRDTLAAQNELDRYAAATMDVLTNSESNEVKLYRLQNIRKSLDTSAKKTRPVLKKLYYDMIDQVDDAINMYKDFV